VERVRCMDPEPGYPQAERARASGGGFQRVGGLVEVPGLLRELGCSPEPVLSRAGVDPAVLGTADHRISYAAATTLLHECAAATGRHDFGLLAGQRWRLAHLGTLGAVMKSAPTVGEALQLLATYQHRNSDVGAAFVLQQDEFASLGYVVYRQGVPHLAYAYDVAMAFACNILRELAGPRWRATEVLLSRYSRRMRDRIVSTTARR